MATPVPLAQSQQRQRNGQEPDALRSHALLTGVAIAAQRLLSIADFDAAVNGALEAIATSANIDRIFVYEHHSATPDTPEFATCPYEWTAAGIPMGSEVPDRFPMVYSEIEGFSDWAQALKAGESVQKLKTEMSADGQAVQDIDQALSVLTVPIFVEGEYWGNFGFDDCTTARVWGKAEIAVLETAAATFAAALQRRGSIDTLRSRDVLLDSVNAAAQCMVATENLDEAIPQALRILGEGTRQDRVYLFENVYPNGPDELFWAFNPLHEWNSPKAISIREVVDQFPFPANAFPETVFAPLANGKAVQFLTRELEGAAAEANEDVASEASAVVPILVAGEYWGLIGFDDCVTERVWSDAEIAVLETAAACIGSAIERDRTRKEKEAAAKARVAELAERDRILEATAAAANVMLTDADFDSAVNTALKIVGEGLNVDRVALGQYFEANSERSFGYIHFFYEWVYQDTLSQIVGTDLAKISDEGIEFIYDTLRAREVFGGIVDELPEPFRSVQIELDVKSTYAIPVMVNGNFWGVIALDDCEYTTQRSEAELEALMTFANCIGSAIERENNKREKEAVVIARATELAERDCILEATAAAANVMLLNDDFESAVNEALQIVGEGLNVDRVLLGQHFEAPSERESAYCQFLHEWVSAGTLRQIEYPQLQQVSEEGIEFVFQALCRGETFGGVIDELPEPFRSGQQELGVKSTYDVPIFVEGSFWGVVGLDDCHQQTRRSESELEALKTLANCIGSTIERDRMRVAREAAERTAIIERERAARADELEAANKILTTRDRWLQTTATAANQLLSQADVAASVNLSLKTLGENLACDRLSVMRYQPDHESHPLGAMNILYEWDAEGIRSQSEDPELQIIPATGLEDWFEQFLQGECVGGNLSDLSEPARSGQAALGVLSTYAVPIFIEEDLWGIVGMDYCREEKQLGDSELAVFRTAASCIGSAIYQAQARRDRAAQERAKLLGSVAEAANLLLRTADYETVLPEVTRLLGEAVGSDRCSINQDVIHQSSGNLALKLLHEWARDGLQAMPDSASDFLVDGLILLEGSFLEFHRTLLRGEVINFFVSETSPAERAFLEAQGNTSMLIVPILVEGQCWGSIGFDNCGKPRLYDEAEIAILQIAAESIASAIARQAQESALRESEKLYRTLFEVSAEGIYRLEMDEPIPTDLSVDEQVALCYERACGADANQSFVEMYGYQNPEEMIGWRLTNLHVEGSEKNDSFMRDLVLNRYKIENYETEELSIEGEKRYFLNNVVGIVEADCLVEYWGTQTDITELKRAQFEREEAEKAILAEQEKAAQERATELAKTNEAISRTLSTLATNPELDNFLCMLVKELSNVVGAQSNGAQNNTALFLYNKEDNTLYRHIHVQDGKAYIGSPPRDAEMLKHPFPADTTDGWRLILESPQPITFAEIGTPEENPNDLWWDDTVAWHISEGHQEVAFARLKVGDVPLGYIGFCFMEKVTFSAEKLELIQALSNQATLAIQLTQLAEDAKQTAILQEQEKAARDRAAQLSRSNRALKRSLDLLAQQPELEAFLQSVVNEAAAQTGAASGQLFLSDTDINVCWLRVSTDNNGDWRSVPDMELWSQPVSTTAAPDFWAKIYEKKVLIVEDLPATLVPGPHIWEPSIAWHLQRGHTSFICAPLVLGEQVIGFLGLPFVGETRITQEAVELAQALTNQATLAIQFTRLAEEAKENAVLQEQEKAASQRAAQLASSNESISKTLINLAARPELDEFLGYILAEMSRQLGAGKVHLFLYDEPTHTLSQRVVVQDGKIHLGAAPTDPNILHHPIPADLTPAWSTIISSGKRLTYDETLPYDEELWWPETIEWHKAQGHKAVTCIPMKAGEQPIGYIGFCFYNNTFITDEQLEFMQALANQAIVAIQLTRLAEEAKENAILQEQEKAARDRAVELAKTNEALGETLSVLTTTPELDDFLGQVLCKISQPVQACKALLFLYNEETHTLHAHLSVHDGQQVYKGTAPNDPDMFHHPIPADISPAWERIIHSSKPWTLDENNPADADLWWPASLPWNKAEGHCAATCAVMKVGGKPIGFIALAFRTLPLLTNEQLEFIQALTNQATLAVHLTRLAEHSKTAALTNVLTNERNRLAREIHDTLAQSFTGVSLQLEAAKGILSNDPETARTYIKRAGKLARQGLSEARRSVRALRSQALETDTLPTALQIALTEMTQESPVQTEFQLTGTPYPLPEDIQTNLLRIGQEAITNTLRHANAETLRLTLQFHPHHIQMNITDDGQGSAITSLAEVEGFGLLGMRERVLRFDGQFTFNSAPGKGTVIDITMPTQEEPLKQSR